MRQILFVVWFVTLSIHLSCNQEEHFIRDPDYRAKVREQFRKQKELARHRHAALFDVLRQPLSTKELEALEFLYAFMSLNDLADYSGEFYLKNVRSSLAARDTFSWGQTIPDEIFRHFVLPVRVNNENLDSSRWVFLQELKERIKELSMAEASLEVNHWCHEKVTYKATDSRTSSPLAVVKTAYGRCGEESTFTTAALRAVSIPARQCYTPRWAHGDDNHAWVEVWVDGSWHYLGACEPEPELDKAWFTAPAKRAMLVTTNVFGDYTGAEDLLVKDERYTKINLLPNYTRTKRIWTRVLDIQQNPIAYAEVEFQLYNYAEFYPLHRARTDARGLASLLTGYGDLLIWASKGGFFGFARADVRSMDTVNVYLELTHAVTGGMNLDFTPPMPQNLPEIQDDSIQHLNTQRLLFEDNLRASYEATFIDSVKAFRLASTLAVDPDTLWHFLHLSRGNWREIVSFVSAVPDTLKKNIFPLLNAISEKDLRDIDPEVLLDAVRVASSPQPADSNGRSRIRDRDLFPSFVMNPRIDNEWLKPFHRELRQKFQPDLRRQIQEDPEVLVSWIREHIRIDSLANYSKTPITPVGVMDLRVADPHSRDIFFVAACRSLGIPARLEPATKVPQVDQDGSWKDIFFSTLPSWPDRTSTLVLTSDRLNPVSPEYYAHYTVEQFTDGFFRTLDCEHSHLVNQFPATLPVAPNTYMVVSGNRLSDGTVLARIFFARVEAGKTFEIPVLLRQDFTPPPVFGSFLQEKLKSDLAHSGISINPSTGVVMAWIDPGNEPTSHFLDDLKKQAAEIESWPGSIILFLQDRMSLDEFNLNEQGQLPRNTLLATFDAYPFNLLYYSLDIPIGGQYPLVLFVNPNGIINFHSEGYRIGTGEALVRLMKRKF